MDDAVSKELARVLEECKPTVAGSVLKTFHKVTAFVFSLCWLACLPVELMLHRRIGKRYCNTWFVLMSLVLYVFVSTACITLADMGSSITRGPEAMLQYMHKHAKEKPVPPWGFDPTLGSGNSPTGNTTTAHNDTTSTPSETAFFIFSMIQIVAIIAFIGHYVANRRRFGTHEQGHSLDMGIPTIIYPPFVNKLLPAKKRIRLTAQAVRNAPSVNLPLSHVLAQPYKIFGQFREAFTHHVRCLRRGEVPHGPFNWLMISLGEPALLLALGLSLIFLTNLAAVGIYFAIISAGLFFKGAVMASEWKECALTDNDQRLESEAMNHWRAGYLSTAIAKQFTVPIASAILAKRHSNYNEPIMVGPEFDSVLRDDDEDQRGVYRQAA